MLSILAGVGMLALPVLYWSTRPSRSRPRFPWQVLYVRPDGSHARSGGVGDTGFVVAWTAVAIGAIIRGAI